MNISKAKQTLSVRKMVLTGMMIAITVVLTYTPLGVIPIPPLSATISHVPTLIITILEGPLVGLITGTAFGLATLFRAITTANPLDKLFINPFVSVLPRMLIAVVTHYVYRGVLLALEDKKGATSIGIIVASALGSIANTVGVLGMLYIFYASRITEVVGTAALAFIVGIAGTYGIVEMAVASGITLAVATALKKAMR